MAEPQINSNEIWNEMLKKLSEKGENSLISLISNLEKRFTDSGVTIITTSPAEFSALNKNQEKINALAAGGYTVEIKKEERGRVNENLSKIQELFGGKLRK